MADDASADLNELTATVVANYVSHNSIEASKLGELIHEVHRALAAAGSPTPSEPEVAKPDKVAIRKSISQDFLTSFIDGRKYKSLKRHLSRHGSSPGEYRERYGLPNDYPMVAPGYSAQRSELAKSLGLGRKAATAAQPKATGPKKSQGRAKPSNAAGDTAS